MIILYYDSAGWNGKGVSLSFFLKISSRSLYRRFSRKKSPTFVFFSSLKEKNEMPYTHTSTHRKVSSPKTLPQNGINSTAWPYHQIVVFHLAYVESVSVRFRSKERETRVKDLAKNGARKRAGRVAMVQFFARPKLKIPFLGLFLLRNQTQTLATSESYVSLPDRSRDNFYQNLLARPGPSTSRSTGISVPSNMCGLRNWSENNSKH